MKKKSSTQPEPVASRPWTFLTNHAHVLIVLYGEPDLSLREVAMRVGITERAVQRIVQDLEDGGYLSHEKSRSQKPLFCGYRPGLAPPG